MITNFEGITNPLTPEENQLVNLLVNAFNNVLIGVQRAKTNGELTTEINSRYPHIKLNEVRLRKLINHIRNNNLVIGLCATSQGYFKAATQQEYYDTLKSLKDRIDAQSSTYKLMLFEYQRLYSAPSNTPKSTPLV